MNNFIASALLFIFTSTFILGDYPVTTDKEIQYTLKKREVVILKRQLLDILSLNEEYSDLRDAIKNSSVNDVKIEKLNTGTYKLTAKIKAYEFNIIFSINEQDFIDLQNKYNRLRNGKPVFEKEWIDEAKKKLKISLSVDDVKWSTTITIHQIESTFSWTSYFWGIGTGVGIVVLLWLLTIFA